MSIEKPSNQEKSIPHFEKVFAEMNLDLQYQFSELTGHNPADGIWKIQLLEPITSNTPGNAIALNMEKTEAYVNLLRGALEKESENEYLVTVNSKPTVHIVVEKVS